MINDKTGSWNRAFDGVLPKNGQKVLAWFEHTGYSLETYRRTKYGPGILSEKGGEPCDLWYGETGYFADEDVYWVPLPPPPRTKPVTKRHAEARRGGNVPTNKE